MDAVSLASGTPLGGLTQERVDFALGDAASQAPSQGTSSDLVARELAKTKFCKHALRGFCRYGESCAYAHTATELMPRPNYTKTKICVRFLSGTCTQQDCSYAHGLHELRRSPGPPSCAGSSTVTGVTDRDDKESRRNFGIDDSASAIIAPSVASSATGVSSRISQRPQQFQQAADNSSSNGGGFKQLTAAALAATAKSRDLPGPPPGLGKLTAITGADDDDDSSIASNAATIDSKDGGQENGANAKAKATGQNGVPKVQQMDPILASMLQQQQQKAESAGRAGSDVSHPSSVPSNTTSLSVQQLLQQQQQQLLLQQQQQQQQQMPLQQQLLQQTLGMPTLQQQPPQMTDPQNDGELMREILTEIKTLISEDKSAKGNTGPRLSGGFTSQASLLVSCCLMMHDQKEHLTMTEEQLLSYLFMLDPSWASLFPKLAERLRRQMASRIEPQLAALGLKANGALNPVPAPLGESLPPQPSNNGSGDLGDAMKALLTLMQPKPQAPTQAAPMPPQPQQQGQGLLQQLLLMQQQQQQQQQQQPPQQPLQQQMDPQQQMAQQQGQATSQQELLMQQQQQQQQHQQQVQQQQQLAAQAQMANNASFQQMGGGGKERGNRKKSKKEQELDDWLAQRFTGAPNRPDSPPEGQMQQMGYNDAGADHSGGDGQDKKGGKGRKGKGDQNRKEKGKGKGAGGGGGKSWQQRG
mmetsp:Transcript_13771/g.32393  ORF Transcript_13771/g.32393 Transcript_13771/m.32393 type:complete len:698 (-) Transcript_13771:133-2226(-)